MSRCIKKKKKKTGLTSSGEKSLKMSLCLRTTSDKSQ